MAAMPQSVTISLAIVFETLAYIVDRNIRTSKNAMKKRRYSRVAPAPDDYTTLTAEQRSLIGRALESLGCIKSQQLAETLENAALIAFRIST